MKEYLINEYNDYYPQTAVVYGLFLNYESAQVLGWYFGNDESKSVDLTIYNVAVHDLYHNTLESMGLYRGYETDGEDRDARCVAPLNVPVAAYLMKNKLNLCLDVIII